MSFARRYKIASVFVFVAVQLLVGQLLVRVTVLVRFPCVVRLVVSVVMGGAGRVSVGVAVLVQMLVGMGVGMGVAVRLIAVGVVVGVHMAVLVSMLVLVFVTESLAVIVMMSIMHVSSPACRRVPYQY